MLIYFIRNRNVILIEIINNNTYIFFKHKGTLYTSVPIVYIIYINVQYLFTV